VVGIVNESVFIKSFSNLFEFGKKSGRADCCLFLSQDGTFEQIILDIKAEPYRTNDAMRRSVRRSVNSMVNVIIFCVPFCGTVLLDTEGECCR
jgi:hypothetical protein